MGLRFTYNIQEKAGRIAQDLDINNDQGSHFTNQEYIQLLEDCLLKFRWTAKVNA